MVPLLVEPFGQRVITKDGGSGRIKRLTNVGLRVACVVRPGNGERIIVLATHLTLAV